ncbi:MAG: terminase family protein [Thermoleophilia bacterium]|nr:terminase family protein [Thermoleophilia bacterium]
MRHLLPRVGLVEACADPALFGVDLWPRQCDLLATVEAGPRLHVWALGRRSGKTTMAAMVALWDCLLRPELGARVRPGEVRHAVAVATNHRQARLFVQAARSIVERSPLLAELVEQATEDEITFVNGTALSAFPCSSRGARGWPIWTLVMDEAAHFLSETEGPQVAERVFEALVPSTAQFGAAARVIVCSTPFGVGSLFATLFQRAWSGELEDALAQHATTAEMNPTIDPGFLELDRQRDPESFRAEFEAEFLAGGAAFLDPGRIADALADRAELAPGQVVDCVAGLDPAFSSDPFGLAIVGRDPADCRRLVLALAQRWRPPRRRAGSFEERRTIEDAVLDEVAEVCRRYRARAVTDQFAAPAVVSYLRQRGVAVRVEPMTAQAKTQAYVELRARLNTSSLELYEESVLLGELRRLRSRYAAGRASVVSPRAGDSHGDIAQALALAVFEHDRFGPRLIEGDDGEGSFLAGEVVPAGWSAGLDGPMPGYGAVL